MSFDPNLFLDLAKQLAQNIDDEAKVRTAVGRAYYSVFLQARDKLGLERRRHDVHKATISALRGKDRAAGDQLDNLEKLRGEADYEMSVIDTMHKDWKWNWDMADNYALHILRRLKALK